MGSVRYWMPRLSFVYLTENLSGGAGLTAIPLVIHTCFKISLLVRRYLTSGLSIDKMRSFSASVKEIPTGKCTTLFCVRLTVESSPNTRRPQTMA